MKLRLRFLPSNIIEVFTRLPSRAGGFQDAQRYLASQCGQRPCPECQHPLHFSVDDERWPWWSCGCGYRVRAPLVYERVITDEKWIKRLLKYRAQWGDGGFQRRLSVLDTAEVIPDEAPAPATQQDGLFGT